MRLAELQNRSWDVKYPTRGSGSAVAPRTWQAPRADEASDCATNQQGNPKSMPLNQ